MKRESFAFNFCLECAVVLSFESTCGVRFALVHVPLSCC